MKKKQDRKLSSLIESSSQMSLIILILAGSHILKMHDKRKINR